MCLPNNWSTSVDSDHALVCATICMRFGGKPKSNCKHMNTSKLANPEFGEKYRQLLTNSLTVEHSDNLEDRWSRLRTACLTAGMEVCGTTQRRHQTWISTESIRLLDSQRSLTDPMQTAAKRELRRELRQSLRKDREKWWVERAREMEIASLCGNTRRLFQLIRATGIKRPSVSETIRESDGSKINNMSKRINRWVEHFSAQFNQPQLPDVESLGPPDRSWPVSLEPPTEVEVRAVILSLKRHKAPGSDNLPAELLREGGDAIIDELCSLFRIVWVEERIPSSWGESIISPIYKKGDRQDCANYRGISLLPVISKVFASLLLRRLSPHRERTIGEEQAGFRPGRGCVDQIFALRQMLEHRYSYRRPTIIVFLDIRAAFDSVNRAMLWNALLAKGVPPKYVKLLQELYRHTSSQVRVYGTLSQRFAVTSGVRQGCPISPFLFNFAIEKVLENALGDLTDSGIELLPGSRLVHLDYADDIALLGDNPMVTQEALDRLVLEAAKYGLAFAPEKCKVLLQNADDTQLCLSISGRRLEVVDSFTYLGSRIGCRDTGSMGDEVCSRIAKARAAFTNLRHLWRRRDISFRVKGRVYAASVRAVLLYGCETWPLRVEDVKRLSVFDNRCLRTIARVWWQQRVSNDEVRRRVLGDGGKELEVIISEHSLRWLGHVLRMPSDRLPKRSLLALPGPNWKKPSGGQRMTWQRRMKSLTECLASVGAVRLPGWGKMDGPNRWLETLEVMARDRNQWRECCRTCIKETTKKSSKRRV